MAKVTLNAYRGIIRDASGNTVGVVGGGIDEANGNQMLTANGTFAALPDETKIVRVATDMAIHFKADGAGAANTDPLIPANSVEYFGVGEGATPSFITA